MGNKKYFSYNFYYHAYSTEIGQTIGSTIIIVNEKIHDATSYINTYDKVMEELGKEIGKVAITGFQLLGEEFEKDVD